VQKLTGAFFNFPSRTQTKSKFKMVLQEKKNQEFSVVIRFTSSSAFENSEDSHESSFCRLSRKTTQKFALQKNHVQF
jgi:hypothetical protein